jgi:alkylation response protein AidB-like acyl-CoA dehydrogenase
MDFNLPEHVVMLRDSLARFIDQHMPREAAKKWDAANHFPKDVFAKLAELGVMGLTKFRSSNLLSFWILRFIIAEALNTTTRRGKMGTLAPVLGFRPIR